MDSNPDQYINQPGGDCPPSGVASGVPGGIPVALLRCKDYSGPKSGRGSLPQDDTPHLPLADAVEQAFALAGYAPCRGERVLVKPNLLRADALTCTSPQVVRAACQWLLDRGVSVSVGDSPGFGTAPGVAQAIGLTAALEDLRDSFGNSVRILPQGLGKPVTRQVPGIGSIQVARYALEADSILSVPRLKAHVQMRITCAVKNLFGCVSGVHKAIAHARHGDKGEQQGTFPRFIAELIHILPPQAALVDAITAMHITGPSNGKPYPLRLVAASRSCVAADTAVYSVLGLAPAQIPLWRVLQQDAVPGAFLQDIILRGAPMDAFDAGEFQIPETLQPQAFKPWRLLKSAVRRAWAALS